MMFLYCYCFELRWTPHPASPHPNKCSSNENKWKRKFWGATIIAKLTKVHNIGVKLPIELDHKTWNCFGKNVSLYRSYATYNSRGKAGILRDNWGRV